MLSSRPPAAATRSRSAPVRTWEYSLCITSSRRALSSSSCSRSFRSRPRRSIAAVYMCVAPRLNVNARACLVCEADALTSAVDVGGGGDAPDETSLGASSPPCRSRTAGGVTSDGTDAADDGAGAFRVSRDDGRLLSSGGGGRALLVVEAAGICKGLSGIGEGTGSMAEAHPASAAIGPAASAARNPRTGSRRGEGTLISRRPPLRASSLAPKPAPLAAPSTPPDGR